MNAIRVLIVEDDPLNLELFHDVLEADGFIVFRAQTAQEGIHLAREVMPDLVLMDFGLPDMHGLLAAKAIRDDPATLDVPVIALTAHAMKGDQEQAFGSGCGGYITKPIDTKTFAATVRSFIKQTQSHIA